MRRKMDKVELRAVVMNVTREATTVTVDTVDDVLVVGFARLDPEGVPEEYVILQRSVDPDEDEPGISGVYVERDDQRFAAYGGIVRFVLRRDQALIELDNRAGGTLGHPDVWREVALRFSIDDVHFTVLRGGLERVELVLVFGTGG